MAAPWRRSARLDADVVDYFSRIASIGGGLQNSAYSEMGTKRRLSDFFVSLKDNGLWPSISEMGIFLGVSNLTSCLAKAKYQAGGVALLTNVNFVAGDHTPAGTAAGLKGDGVTKYLDTGTNQTSLAQNALSMWVYLSAAVGSGSLESFIGANASPGAQVYKQATTNMVSARLSTSTVINSVFTATTGVIGFSRSGASAVDWRVGTGTGSSGSATSAAMGSGAISILARGGANPAASTVAMYGFGGTIDLSVLKLACDAAFSAFGGAPV